MKDEELRKLKAFYDSIETLNLDDLGCRLNIRAFCLIRSYSRLPQSLKS